ncbi:MAG: DUF5916 domain-containing protein [Myxococcota bacterium]|nr:DUF5916 domain-containing protein [Myxococcota bacterium]
MVVIAAIVDISAAALADKTLALRAGALPDDFKLDGHLSETAWRRVDAIDELTMVMPQEGDKPTGQTIVKVLSNRKYIAIGIDCMDPKPGGIVSYSVGRDADLGEEDHIKIVIDTFGDGRSGYVFAVNPSGARYDALVAHRGEGENKNWDGMWQAKTTRHEGGWSAEILIPVRILSFKKGLARWSFNLERRIQRLMETSRWATPRQDYRITQTGHAGAITHLPDFDLGFGLSTRPSLLVGYGSPSIEADGSFESDFSVDITQKLGPNVLASLTVNTDFAETEVDEFRTNLTRFPLFLPEKRSFFLEGSEIFDFGLGIGQDAMPFHSRRIGLVDGVEVPIWLGAKLHGQVGGASLGGLVVNMKETDQIDETNMGVFRVKQNVFKESSVGLIGTFGDPWGRKGSWTLGADFTYQTSEFLGDKNFLVGIWGMVMDREDPIGRMAPGNVGATLGDDRYAIGGKIDYPNDLWDMKFVYVS